MNYEHCTYIVISYTPGAPRPVVFSNFDAALRILERRISDFPEFEWIIVTRTG